MDTQTFRDPRVLQLFRSCFVPVRVEVLEPRAGPLVQRYRILTFPTILVLDARQHTREYLRIPGFFGPTELLHMLRYVSDGWHRRMAFSDYLDRLGSGNLPAGPSPASCPRPAISSNRGGGSP